VGLHYLGLIAILILDSAIQAYREYPFPSFLLMIETEAGILGYPYTSPLGQRFPLPAVLLSYSQLSAWIIDNEGFAVSESTVYRILRREGLVKRQETQLAAAKEYHTKDHAGRTRCGLPMLPISVWLAGATITW